MRILFYAFATLASFVTLVSCKGDKGELGPAGTSDVKYSNWIRVSDANWTETSRTLSSGDSTIYYSAEVPTPAVTQDVLDKGTVAYYIKDASAFGKNTVRHFDLHTAMEDWYVVGTTNRTFAQQNHDFGWYAKYQVYTKADTIPKGKLTIYTTWNGSPSFYNPAHWQFPYMPSKQKYEELKPKTDFYIRYVIIPAGTPIDGRTLSVDLTDYEAVKKHYRIKD